MKNKKGKKKNKMAGRSRPGREQSPEVGDIKSPTDSEIDETAELPKNEDARVTDVELQTTDSGIDSGRGSPGDDPVKASKVTGDSQSKGDENVADPKVSKLPHDDTERRRDEQTEDEPTEKTTSAQLAEEEIKQTVNTESESNSNDEPESKTNSNIKAVPNNSGQQETAEICKADATKTISNRSCPKAKVRLASKNNHSPEKASTATAPSSHVEGAVSNKPYKLLAAAKHPLEFPWEFWTLLPDRSWSESLVPLGSFDTVEDFWCSFSMVRNPQALRTPVFMFKKDIRPEWEDSRNQNGGRWNLIHGLQDKAAEEVWHELTLMLIGGIEFAHLTPHLNGIYCAWRGDGLHFSIWIDSIDESIAKPIGQTVQRILNSVLGRLYPMELMHTRSKPKKRYILLLE